MLSLTEHPSSFATYRDKAVQPFGVFLEVLVVGTAALANDDVNGGELLLGEGCGRIVLAAEAKEEDNRARPGAEPLPSITLIDVTLQDGGLLGAIGLRLASLCANVCGREREGG